MADIVKKKSDAEGADLEHAKSELADGVLTLVIPKLPGAKLKKIPISAGGARS